MKVDIEHVSGGILLRPLAPRLDAMQAPGFRETVLPRVSGLQRVVIDLTSVRAIDSTGLGCLISVLKALAPGGSVALLAVSPEVAVLLKLTRLDRVLRAYDSLDAALSA